MLLLLPPALAVFAHVPFFFAPTLLPAAVLMFLAALFSLGASVATSDADVERQPLIRPSSTPAPRHRRLLILGIVVAFLGGAAFIFLFQFSWIAILIVLAISSIGATLLIRSPLSALAVPAAIWLGAMLAVLYNGATHAAFIDATFWWGTLEFAGILIVIAVIPSLIGVAIGALLTRWVPGGTA
jgi:hypothetical protein